MVFENHRGERRDRAADSSPRYSRALPLFVTVFSIWPSLANAQPTFSTDVAPIIWNRCSTCHRPGEIGPFSLITYDEVRRHATQIAAGTARRLMPPWKPAAATGEFVNERRLTDAELQTLQRWIA